jgi:hypothetical protein
MITLVVIFLMIYHWRNVKNDYLTEYSVFCCAAIITTETITDLSLITITANTLTKFII